MNIVHSVWILTVLDVNIMMYISETLKRNKVMKKIILLALTALIMVGCDERQPDGTYKPGSYRTYVIDSCEYIGYAASSQYDFLAHKGNCRFCKERDSIKWEQHKKELEELVIKLREK